MKESVRREVVRFVMGCESVQIRRMAGVLRPVQITHARGHKWIRSFSAVEVKSSSVFPGLV